MASLKSNFHLYLMTTKSGKYEDPIVSLTKVPHNNFKWNSSPEYKTYQIKEQINISGM